MSTDLCHTSPRGNEGDNCSSGASSASSGGEGDEELSLSLESMNFRRKSRVPSSVEVEHDDPDLSAVTLNISHPYFVPLNERDNGDEAGGGGGLVPSTAKSDDKKKKEDASNNDNGREKLLKRVLNDSISDSLTEDPDIRRSLTEDSLLGNYSAKRRSSLGFDTSERLTSLFEGSLDISEKLSFDANRTGLGLNLDSFDRDLSVEGCSGEDVGNGKGAPTKCTSNDGGESSKGGQEAAADEGRILSELGDLVFGESYLPAGRNNCTPSQGRPPISVESGPGKDRNGAHLVDAVTSSEPPPTDRRSSTTTLKWKNTGKAMLREGKEGCVPQKKPVA